MATARALLEAVAEGREEPAWEHAKALARGVLDENTVKFAKAVLDAGPFALRRAIDLAEAVLGSAQAHEVEKAKRRHSRG